MLSWPAACFLGAGLLVASLVASRLPAKPGPPVSWVGRTAPYWREAGLLALLYAVWQLLLDVLVTGTAGAVGRGRWIWRAERSVHLPSEASLQHLALGHPLSLRLADLYYAGVHFPAMGLFLLWVFARRRSAYPGTRAGLIVFTTLASFVQSLPVAPPRLVPGLGVIDAAARLGQSVYPAHGLSDPAQLIAMPSVHVGWAALIAYGTFRLGRGRWRWIGTADLVVTVWVVVATGNHYWADGLAAFVLLALAVAVTAVVTSVMTSGVTSVMTPGVPSVMTPGVTPDVASAVTTPVSGSAGSGAPVTSATPE